MKTAGLLILTLVAAGAARADFSYVTVQKGGSGPMASMGPQSAKQYFKGQKTKAESGDFSTIIDFDAKTVTLVNNSQKSYTVTNFSAMADAIPQGASAQIDLKQTGQKKTINGFNSSQAVLTMDVDAGAAAQGMKMTMEIELWVSPDVPGASELKAFYAKNANNFPTAMGPGVNSPMQKSMAEIQKKMAGLGGVAVLQIVRMKPAGGAPSAAQAPPGMAQAMAQLEALKKQGGAQAQAAEAAMKQMGGMGGSGGALFEMTMESSDFSTAAIPDSVFAIPAGFTKR